MIINENGWDNHKESKEEVKEALKAKKLKKDDAPAEAEVTQDAEQE